MKTMELCRVILFVRLKTAINRFGGIKSDTVDQRQMSIRANRIHVDLFQVLFRKADS